MEYFNRCSFIILLITLNYKYYSELLSPKEMQCMDVCFWHLYTKEIEHFQKGKRISNVYFTYSSLNSVKHIWPAFKCLNFKDFCISTNLEWSKKYQYFALAEWFSWLECCPVHQKGQGTHPSCGFDQINVSLHVSLSFFLSL